MLSSDIKYLVYKRSQRVIEREERTGELKGEEQRQVLDTPHFCCLLAILGIYRMSSGFVPEFLLFFCRSASTASSLQPRHQYTPLQSQKIQNEK